MFIYIYINKLLTQWFCTILYLYKDRNMIRYIHNHHWTQDLYYKNHFQAKLDLRLTRQPIIQTSYISKYDFPGEVDCFSCFSLLIPICHPCLLQWQAQISPHLVVSHSTLAVLSLPISHTPHPPALNHEGLIKTDWVLGDHTCLWQ